MYNAQMNIRIESLASKKLLEVDFGPVFGKKKAN